MRTIIPVAIGIFISLDSNANANAGIDLSQYYWKNRPLLLFAHSPEAPAYRAVVEDLNARSDQIADRDMVIIEVFETGLVRVDAKPVPGESADDLRRRFSVTEGMLTAILVGKDGGRKLRQTGRLDLEEIFDLIDSMPMRQREMRNKSE